MTPLSQPPLSVKASPLHGRTAPSTRYQGSKRKLLNWIWDSVGGIPFQSALDLFSGTASVSYLFKAQGKSVTCNDYLRSSHQIGMALIENSSDRLSDVEVDFVCRRQPDFTYDDLIARNFHDIYFTDAENAWLDVACQNIPRLSNAAQRALAYAALFQACLRKRPYNLFHRRNLYMRTASVRRGFGNKATWDTPFEKQFRHFVAELNGAVFDSGVPCRSLCQDARHVSGTYDLVYIDPPYVSGAGVGVDYLDFYHFLDGMLDYRGWESRIDRKRKHLPLRGERSVWSDPRTIRAAFEELFARHAAATLVVSYRSDGIPSEAELVEMLRRVKRQVRCTHFGEYQYALSKNAGSRELLLIGSDTR